MRERGVASQNIDATPSYSYAPIRIIIPLLFGWHQKLKTPVRWILRFLIIPILTLGSIQNNFLIRSQRNTKNRCPMRRRIVPILLIPVGPWYPHLHDCTDNVLSGFTTGTKLHIHRVFKSF